MHKQFLFLVILAILSTLKAEESNSSSALTKESKIQKDFFETSSSYREFSDEDDCPALSIYDKELSTIKALDSDLDGIANTQDRCPHTVNCKFKVDVQGCLITLEHSIDFNSTGQLTDEAYDNLSQIAVLARDNYTSKIILIGSNSSYLKEIERFLTYRDTQKSRIEQRDARGMKLAQNSIKVKLYYPYPHDDDKDRDGVVDNQDRCPHPYDLRNPAVEVNQEGCIILPSVTFEKSKIRYNTISDFIEQFQEFCNASYPTPIDHNYTLLITFRQNDTTLSKQNRSLIKELLSYETFPKERMVVDIKKSKDKSNTVELKVIESSLLNRVNVKHE
ncbi:MAG: hypothetical protein U9N49_10450 [Campylobacterota bacterium]|nr:hypothetical protein [Campylobacterota bacterium]